MLRLTTGRDFRLIWSASIASQLGDWAARLALALLVLERGGGATTVGVIGALFVVPWLGPGQLLTAWSARFGRRVVLIACDSFRGVAFIVIGSTDPPIVVVFEPGVGPLADGFGGIVRAVKLHGLDHERLFPEFGHLPSPCRNSRSISAAMRAPAISSFVFYDGDAFHEWRHNIIVGSLKAAELYRLVIENNQLVHKELLIKDLARIRDVEVGYDGFIYLLLENKAGGEIVRLVPEAMATDSKQPGIWR